MCSPLWFAPSLFCYRYIKQYMSFLLWFKKTFFFWYSRQPQQETNITKCLHRWISQVMHLLWTWQRGTFSLLLRWVLPSVVSWILCYLSYHYRFIACKTYICAICVVRPTAVPGIWLLPAIRNRLIWRWARISLGWFCFYKPNLWSPCPYKLYPWHSSIEYLIPRNSHSLPSVVPRGCWKVCMIIHAFNLHNLI
jgi:hypothetical protein